ncbi:MAG: cupin domain-containing protein [Pseudomonadota bacterium]
MSDDPKSDEAAALAAGYVLGLLGPAEEAAAARAMAEDAGFRRLVLAWEERLAPLAPDAAAPVGEALWRRIERAVGDAERAPGTRTVAPADGVWERIAPGVERKVVHVDRASDAHSYLVRMAAGAALPAHDHAHDEECVVLEGELEVGGAVFGAGAFHFAAKDRAHAAIVARRAALFFVRGAL